MEAKDRPDYETAAYKAMCPNWDLVEAVSSGTRKLREAKEKYLPKEEAEKDGQYQKRIERSVLFNAYSRTRDALVGLVTKNNPVVNDASPEIQKHLEDIDLAGNHFDVFAKELFNSAFDGHSLIFVDMAKPLPPGSTKADEIQQNRRPNWVSYKARQVKNWRVDRVNGEMQITQITFEEMSNEPSGRFGEESRTRYRVLALEGDGLVHWYLFEKVTDSQNNISFEDKGNGVLQDGPKRIPVAVVYGQKEGILESCPPLLDLAYLNIAHWQEYSDYRTQLHALVPILVRKGMPAEIVNDPAKLAKFKVSVNSLADIPAEGALEYVSHDGKAISAARQELIDLEQRIALLGLSMLSQKADSNITATEKRQDWMQQSSDLATMARSLQDALELALQFHAEYLGDPSECSVQLGVAASDLAIDGRTIVALNDMVSLGRLTLETLLTLLQRGGLTAIEVEKELEMLKAGNVFQGTKPTLDLATKMQMGMSKILTGAKPNEPTRPTSAADSSGRSQTSDNLPAL